MVDGKTFIVGGDLNTARLAEKVWPRHGHGPFLKDFPRAYSLIVIKLRAAERNKPSFEKAADTPSKMTICSSVMT